MATQRVLKREFTVLTNMYSHDNSGFSAVASKHSTIDSAIHEADKLMTIDKRRFAFVEDHDGKRVYRAKYAQ